MRSRRLDQAVIPILLWTWLAWNLHFEWSLNPQYNYGWAVPMLAVLLFYGRWQDRPVASHPISQRTASILRVALLASLLPLRVIEEANPDWRLLSWVLALTVVAYSLISLGNKGGAGWAKHFAFPVCFTLVAVPWLVRIENVVVQTMTKAVASVAVEVAGWVGIAAFQLGHVIQLPSGYVGVDEACSGVKTLQAAIMLCLFFGELRRLSTKRRLILLAAGCAWVFACNIARAAGLVAIAGKTGMEALSRWHDFVGTAVLLVGMAGVFAIAFLLRPDPRSSVPAGTSIDTLPPRSSAMTLLPLAWFALIFLGSDGWYRLHERTLIERPAWRIALPTVNPSLASLKIPETTRAILRYNDASSAAWKDESGAIWWMFFAHWEPQRAALQLVRSHSPEVCLPAVGRSFRRELEAVTIQTGVGSLVFRAYEFEQEGKPLLVFVSVQEDKVAAGVEKEVKTGWNTRGRLLAAWHGERNLGQRLLEIALSGYPDFQAARAAIENAAPKMILPTTTTD